MPASLALTDLDDDQLAALVLELGGERFQARQLSHWMYRHGADNIGACRNLPQTLRQRLAAWGSIASSTVEATHVAGDGTAKHLIRLADGELIETVLIPEGERSTLCISTQVGCPVGCVFCASGLLGVRRNLTIGEIVEQVLHARRLLPAPRRLTNLVVMGIGEPLLNLAALLPALARIHDPAGINLGARRITVSTSGYPRQMDAFAAAPHAYNLAVSLHAADDDLRRRLVPTATATVAEILEAARRYSAATGREITFEVVLLEHLNDRPEDADALVRRLHGWPCTVNLLAWNPVAQITDLRRPSTERVDRFAERLRHGGLNVTVRRSRGADRSAACGQLRIGG